MGDIVRRNGLLFDDIERKLTETKGLGQEANRNNGSQDVAAI